MWEERLRELEEDGISKGININVAIQFINSLLKEQTQWVGIEDKPKTKGDYLVYSVGELGGTYIDQSYFDGEYFKDVNDNPDEYITHWMPLPPPPEGEVK